MTRSKHTSVLQHPTHSPTYSTTNNRVSFRNNGHQIYLEQTSRHCNIPLTLKGFQKNCIRLGQW